MYDIASLKAEQDAIDAKKSALDRYTQTPDFASLSVAHRHVARDLVKDMFHYSRALFNLRMAMEYDGLDLAKIEEILPRPFQPAYGDGERSLMCEHGCAHACDTPQGLTPYQWRVVGEREQLDLKLKALRAFISGDPAYGNQPIEEQLRLNLQAVCMEEYSRILGARIAAFDG